MWLEHRQFGTLPFAGGLLDQPLALLVYMRVLDFVAMTAEFIGRKNADWSKLSALQVDLMRWLESDDGDA